jgi:polar amino acid transport system substrate-binding protein
MRPACRSLLLATLLALGGAWAQADLGGRSLRVGVDPTVPPFASPAASGTLVGLDLALVTAVCDRIGCVPTFVATSWDRLLPHVAAGELDLAAGAIRITAAREAVVDFGRPYLVASHAIAMRRGADPPTERALRDGEAALRLGAELGSTGAQVARELVGDGRLHLSLDAEAARRALLDGEVDGVVIASARAPRWTAATEGRAFVAVDGLAPAPIGLAFGAGSPLRAAFEAGLDALREDGTLDALRDRWLAGEAAPDADR